MAVAAQDRRAGSASRKRRTAPRLSEASAQPPQFDKDEELSAYRDMLLIRRFEEKAGQLYGMGLIGGFCHLYIGQEAIAVGMQMALKRRATRSSPATATTATCWPAAWTRKGVMAELTGRARRLFEAARAARCTCSRRRSTSTAATASSARRSRSAPASRFANSYREQRQRLPHLFRRRRRQPGPGLRELQHGRALEAAGRLRHREQPVRHGHLRRARLGADRSLQARRLVQHPGRAGRRHGRARREGGRRARRRARPLGQGPVHPRDEDLPLSRPLDVRPGQVPHARRRSQKMREEHDPIEQVAPALLESWTA